MMQVRLVLARTMLGITEASTTRNPSPPRTRQYWSTTASLSESGPILPRCTDSNKETRRPARQYSTTAETSVSCHVSHAKLLRTAHSGIPTKETCERFRLVLLRAEKEERD